MSKSTLAARALGTVQSALQTIRGESKRLRAEIATKEEARRALHAEIGHLDSLPVCFDDWLPNLRRYVEACGQKAAPRGSPLRMRVGANLKPFNERKAKELGGSANLFWDTLCTTPDEAAESPFNTLCYYFPDVVFEKLSAHYRETCAAEWGNEEHLRLSERAERKADLQGHIAKLDKEIAALKAELSLLNEVGDAGDDDAVVGDGEPLPAPASDALPERKLRF